MARTEVGKAVTGILDTNVALVALIGTRSYETIVPQDAVAPFVVFQTIDVIPTDTKDRPSPLDKVRLQVDVYAKTVSSREGVSSAIRAALDAYPIGSVVNGVTLDGIAYATERNDIDEETDYYRKSMDFLIRIAY